MKRLLMTKLPLLLGLLLVAQAWLHAQELKIHQINIGAGSCTFIEVLNTAGNRVAASTMLIDAGSQGEASTIRTYLNGIGANTIKTALATHYDEDHIGGFAGTTAASNKGLLDKTATPSITFSEVYDRDWEIGQPTSGVFDRYFNHQTTHYAGKLQTAETGDEFTLYNDANLLIKARLLIVDYAIPKGTYYATSDENRLSIVTLITVKDKATNKWLFSYLNGGDFEARMKTLTSVSVPGARRRRICDRPISVNNSIGDLVKGEITTHAGGYISLMTASHHGAENSFVDVSSRTVSGFNVGTILISSGNRHDHPAVDYLRCLENISFGQVWVTDYDRHGRKTNTTIPSAIRNKLRFDVSSNPTTKPHHIVVSFKKTGSTITRRIWRVSENGSSTVTTPVNLSGATVSW